MIRFFLPCSFLLFTQVISQSPLQHPIDGVKCQSPVVEILVSPLASRKILRELIISWDVYEDFESGDWVGLYEGNEVSSQEPVAVYSVDSGNGWVRTGIAEGRTFPEEPNFNKVCLGWATAYWRANQTQPIASSCLNSNPRWMEEIKKNIQSLSLKDMFIPATHDSASYLLAYSPFSTSRIRDYIYTQDENMLEQLIHGARMLDMRVAKYLDGWYLNHGPARVHTLDEALSDIIEFVNNTQEIVILDFHRFPVGMKKTETHFQLVEYLVLKLGRFMVPPISGPRTTLGQIWDTNKRLIVSYNNRDVVQRYPDILWESVKQKWGDARNLGNLKSYFDNIFRSPPAGVIWSAMTQLTANAWNIITNKPKGLRTMADQVNGNVTQWFRNDWGSKANGVSVDFIRSTGIVNAAIRWNVRRSAKIHC